MSSHAAANRTTRRPPAAVTYKYSCLIAGRGPHKFTIAHDELTLSLHTLNPTRRRTDAPYRARLIRAGAVLLFLPATLLAHEVLPGVVRTVARATEMMPSRPRSTAQSEHVRRVSGAPDVQCTQTPRPHMQKRNSYFRPQRSH